MSMWMNGKILMKHCCLKKMISQMQITCMQKKFVKNLK